MPKKPVSEPIQEPAKPTTVSEPKQKTSVSLPVSALQDLRLLAAAQGKDVTDLVEEAVQERLKRDREKIAEARKLLASAKK